MAERTLQDTEAAVRFRRELAARDITQEVFHDLVLQNSSWGPRVRKPDLWRVTSGRPVDPAVFDKLVEIVHSIPALCDPEDVPEVSSPRLQRACVWLLAVLKDGPVAATKIEELRKRRGLSEELVRVARETIGATTAPGDWGQPWVWTWEPANRNSRPPAPLRQDLPAKPRPPVPPGGRSLRELPETEQNLAILRKMPVEARGPAVRSRFPAHIAEGLLALLAEESAPPPDPTEAQ